MINLKKIINATSDLYVFLFSNKILSKFNNVLLDYVLRVRGYRNSKNFNESGEIFFIKNILAPSQPKLCIDIGANIGNYTLELLKLTNAKVISFEPLPTTFGKLKEKMKLFSDRVIIENIGVGSVNSELIFHYNPKVSEHASFSEEIKKISFISNDQKIVVPVISLDSYCSRHNITEIDFIKIDTEGYEKEVFEGAKLVSGKVRPKFIQMEFVRHQLFRNTSLNYFSEKLLNYEVFQLIPNDWIKRDPRDPYSNIYHYSNFIFVRL
jgi:FkbM family methyltransferase